MFTVWCTTTFEGWHCWGDAPDQYAYLRDSHRHLFHFRAEVQVSSDDRQIEFIELKHRVEQVILDGRIVSRDFTMPTEHSCEAMARFVLGYLVGLYPTQFVEVTVSEDGENGATVTLPSVGVY